MFYQSSSQVSFLLTMDQSTSLTGNLIPNQASGTQIKHSKGVATLDLDQYTFKSMHTEFSIIIILNVLK